MIDLQQLILIAPFPEDTRADLLTKIPTFSDAQKRDLENLSWDLIRENYEEKISFESQNALTEVALGKKKADEVDLEKIENDIFNELTSKIDGINTQEQINEVREKLQAQPPKPN